jgi:hypothetical protein
MELEFTLDERGPHCIAVSSWVETGVLTDACVSSTVRQASDLSLPVHGRWGRLGHHHGGFALKPVIRVNSMFTEG